VIFDELPSETQYLLYSTSQTVMMIYIPHLLLTPICCWQN